jgi:HlyD family secretion protein
LRLCFFAPLREIECILFTIFAAQQAKADLDPTYVKAPQNGVIFDIYTRAGEVVSNNGIVELGQINQMYIC